MARNSLVAFPHLTREIEQIKKFADDPVTANHWCIIRDGKPHQPRRVNQEADPRWLSDLGSLKDCRFALTMLRLQPPIEALAVFPPDDVMMVFPVDLEAKPEDSEAPDLHPQPTDVPEANPGEPEGHPLPDGTTAPEPESDADGGGQ